MISGLRAVSVCLSVCLSVGVSVWPFSPDCLVAGVLMHTRCFTCVWRGVLCCVVLWCCVGYVCTVWPAKATSIAKKKAGIVISVWCCPHAIYITMPAFFLAIEPMPACLPACVSECFVCGVRLMDCLSARLA